MSIAFVVVKHSKIIFLLEDTIPQKEDRILLYIGYHSIRPPNKILELTNNKIST